MTTITSPTFDPVTTAKSLATDSVSVQRALAAAQAAQANSSTSALDSLKAAMSSFQTAMTKMTVAKSVISQGATFSNTSYGTATAGVNASAGSYSFFVETLATASQTSYGGLSSSPAAGSGSLSVKIGDGSAANTLDIDLAAADKNGDGTLTPQEIAASINGNSKNNSRVTASIITVGNQSQLVLTSTKTGVENAITLDASSVTNATLKQALVTDAATNIKPLVQAKDAVVWLGAKTTGTKITQASNTLSNVADVKMTFTKAMNDGDAPVTLTVATDNSATLANVQGFVDAYNKLKTVLDGMLSSGNPAKSIAAGVFAQDSGLNAMRSNMAAVLRQATGNTSLVAYGITAARDGTLSVDSARLKAKVAADPTGIDTLFGNSATGTASGVLGGLDKLMGQWTNGTKGQIMQRQDANTKLLKSLTVTTTRLNNQYDGAYKRYLKQFTDLQIMQEQMQKNVDMFDAMFSSDK